MIFVQKSLVTPGLSQKPVSTFETKNNNCFFLQFSIPLISYFETRMTNFILDAIASPSPGQSLSQWVSQSVMFSEIAIASTEQMTSGAKTFCHIARH